MKKLIIVGLTIASFPLTALAITPGYGAGDIDCVIDYNVNDPNAVGHPCNDTQAIYKRLYNLEVEVNNLDQLNAQLQVKVNSQSATQTPAPAQMVTQTKEVIVRDPDNTKVDALEKRVTALEAAVKFIQTKIMQAITTTIGLLQKLLAR